MSCDSIHSVFKNDHRLIELHVLVREIRAYLNIESSSFHPCIGIKIWMNINTPDNPYHFSTSHYISTPSRGEYRPSGASTDTESNAIELAIGSLLNSFDLGVRDGFSPDVTWLNCNPDY